MGAPDGVGAGLAEAEMADLALLDEPRHGADGVLDRHVRVDAMDVIEIDHLDAEPLEARLAGDRHIVGLAVDAAALPAGSADVAELAGNEELVALALDRLGDQLLVDAGRIGVRRVEHGDAEVDAAMDGRDRFYVVGNAIVGAHAGAAKPDGRYAQALSQLPILHC